MLSTFSKELVYHHTHFSNESIGGENPGDDFKGVSHLYCLPFKFINLEKLARFVIVTLLFVTTLVLFYSILPSIVWIFGGSFKAIAQHPVYVLVFSILILPFQGFLYGECFDENFYSKNRKR